MSYEELYNSIINHFKNNIQTKDPIIHEKIYNSLISWYKSKYEERLKTDLKKDNIIDIKNIIEEINYICRLNDTDKLIEIEATNILKKIMEISNKIFQYAVDVYQKKKEVDLSICDEYEIEINKLEKDIPELMKDRYNLIKSECILDLNYLRNKNTNVFSFRLSNYIR